MQWALEGLDGVIGVETDLARDAFTVTYRPTRLSVDDIRNRIRSLGFRPELSEPQNRPAGTDPATASPPPAAVRAALAEARESGRILLVDFFAEWCTPCLTLEREVLGDPRLAGTLDRYHLVKIDTDKDLESARHFRILALPTLVVIDAEGKELFRHEGMIGADRLARELEDLAGEKKAARPGKK